MDTDRIWRTDNIPLLMLTENGKEYFMLDKQGYLQHFSCNNESWILKTDNIFQQKIQGFDAVVDNQGNAFLIGYNDAGGLYCLSLPTNKAIAAPVNQDGSKTIGHLSACLDEENNLHLLCLYLDNRQKMWWLVYLYQEEKGLWREPAIIDFGHELLEQNGIIIKDLKNNFFILQRLAETGNYCLLLRSLSESDRHSWKSFYFPNRHEECFFPAFLVAPDNTLHFSWISCQDEVLFLSYIQKPPGGDWDSFFRIEIPNRTLTIAPLYGMDSKLVLTFKKDDELLYLLSTNAGKNWKWGEKILLPKEAQLTRFRSAIGSQQREYVFTLGSPPQILYPKYTLDSFIEKVELQKEFQVLDLLSLSLLTHAGNLQAANASLKQKLQQREKELARLFSGGVSQVIKMEEKLHAKKMELQQMETTFKKALEELQKKIKSEKEEFAARNKDLLMQVNELYKKNEELKKEKLILLRNVNELKEQVQNLQRENEKLKVKKSRFLPDILNRLRFK